MSLSKNNPEAFSLLSQQELKKYAQRWVEDNPDIPISRITLYGYHSRVMERVRKNRRPPQYAVVFEIPGLDINLYTEKHLHYSPELLESLPYKDFMDDTDIHDHFHSKSKFIYSNFHAVYKQSPQPDFHQEWVFFPINPMAIEELSTKNLLRNVMLNEPHWTLYIAARLSIEIIAEIMKQDPLYCDDVYCEDICNWLINKYTTSKNPWESKKKKYVDNHAEKMKPIEVIEEKGKTRPWQEYFLHLLCIYSGLDTYKPNEKKRTGWSGIEYAEKCSSGLEIERKDFKRILQKEVSNRISITNGQPVELKGLTLPVFWYEDEKNNTKEVVSNDLIENFKDIVTGELPKFNLKASIEDARRNKYIPLGLLPYVMVGDEQYTPDLLLTLWKKYECDRRGPKEPLTETYENRVGTWYHVFERLAFGRVQGIPIKKSSPPYLPLYYFNDKEGALEKYDREKDPGDPQVKLGDLKEYYTHTLKIPLPGLLFPDSILLGQKKNLQHEEDENKTFIHSADFHSASYNGEEYSFTDSQAAVIKLLYEAYENRTSELSQQYILEEIDGGSRLRDIFKSNKNAWDNLISAGRRKGNVRLNIKE